MQTVHSADGRPHPGAALHVTLPGWAVDSGDHPGFSSGETAELALELAPASPLTRVTEPEPPCRWEALGEDRYRVTGRVTVATRRLTIVDIGVGAFAARPVECGDRFLASGDWFTGDVVLGADPFTYRTFHAHTLGDADITRAWTIQSILSQTDGGPWVPVDATTRDTSGLFLLCLRSPTDQ